MMQMEEIWKPIIDCVKYEVSNMGNVKNIKTSRILKFLSLCGYSHVVLYDNGRKQCLVHRLVLQAFLPIDEIKEVNHKNHIKTDNRLENLEWSTRSENARFQKKRKELSSQYIGVYWNKKSKKWKAQTKINNKSIYIGIFDNEEDAGKAYNDCIIKHNLQQFAILNKFE